MNIIVVSNRFAKARTICLGRCQTGVLVVAGALLFMAASALFGYMFLFRFGGLEVPLVQQLVMSASQSEAEKNREIMQQRMSAMAIKVGEMQAQVLRLEALGERVAKSAGIRKEDINLDRKPGQGGPLVRGEPLSFKQFEVELNRLSLVLDDKSDQLVVMEAVLDREKVRRAALPSAMPISTGFFTSNFGWRIDPFDGQRAMHEGVDFMADSGTPIRAAAGGIVAFSDYHAGYGNMIEIDHGNGLISRYAHASKRLVKEGDVVLRGQKIGEVGSTGRSTGPHLHFEVLSNGVPQNPIRYLNLNG